MRFVGTSKIAREQKKEQRFHIYGQQLSSKIVPPSQGFWEFIWLQKKFASKQPKDYIFFCNSENKIEKIS